jgi:hypothetical protein
MTDAERKAADFLTLAVDKGIISDKEADAIRDAQEKNRQSQRQAMIEESLDSLVTDNTITQAQADKILASWEDQEETRQAEMEKMKSMTDDERKAFMKTLKGEKQNCLAELVDDDVLTQNEADAVAKVLFQKGGHCQD